MTQRAEAEAAYFVDANIPMYAAGAPHPLRQPCVAILEAIAWGDLLAITDVEVLKEILHRYSALGQRERAIEVADLFLQVVPNVLTVEKDDLLHALDVHRRYTTLQARDSLHAAVMQRHNTRYILSADHHFDAVDGITPIDPATWLTHRR